MAPTMSRKPSSGTQKMEATLNPEYKGDGRKVAKKPGKKTKPTAKKTTPASKILEQDAMASQLNIMDRVFQTVTVDQAMIGDGLYMIRQLDNNKIELVNFTKVSFQDVSSEGVDGKIFRFEKLPIELRYKVYEYAVIGDDPLVHRGQIEDAKKDKDFGILRACHWIYKECLPFYWKNVFAANNIPKTFKSRELWMENVRKAHFEWLGYRMKDVTTLQMLQKCKKLESLHLGLTMSCGQPGYNNKPQRLYQDVASIKKFSRTNGFDRLMAFRGLREVVVSRPNPIPGSNGVAQIRPTASDFDALEKFLIQKLTEPIVVPENKQLKGGRICKTHGKDHWSPPQSVGTRKSTRLSNVTPVKYSQDTDDELDLEEPHCETDNTSN